MRIRLLGVGISGFGQPEPQQLGLFDDPEAKRNKEASALSRACDELKTRFGETAVRYGRDLRFDGRVSDTQPKGK